MHVTNGVVLDSWTTLSDEEIVARVADGQIALFELLMRRHNERVYRAARAILRDDAEAEDVMQQAYVNAYTHLHQFGGRAAFATWLTRIAVHEAFARLRRRARYTPMDDDEQAAPDSEQVHSHHSPESQAYAGELRILLERAVDRLPDGSREVFVLRDVEELTTAETADILGIREDAVKTRLSRARHAIRRDLLHAVGNADAQLFSFHRSRCDRVVAAVLARIA